MYEYNNIKVYMACVSLSVVISPRFPYRKVINELQKSRGFDRENILSTFKILVRDLPG